ncbi:hypothetical protein [Coprobacter tertius]|uniref:Fimbrillin-A associated anchor proteins Mfa1 and Mfa2 n=1 Tax=Coprobacter tertius TaxID=2944915 RepID=A0ABT1MKH5_9BACT|nr:hypothetical protein [Coprobacter tertius]MCP9612188.1 hypothetical protein [Coprobacter tertius]
MKIEKLKLFVATALLGFVSCTDEEQNNLNSPSDLSTTKIRFEMNLNFKDHIYPFRNLEKPMGKNDFRILAFRQESGTGNYRYLKDVDTDNMSITDNKLSGTATLPIGTYKFIPVAGINERGNFTMDDLVKGGTFLHENLGLNLNSSLSDTHSLFLEKRTFEEIPDYTLGLSNESNPIVKSTLNRGVSRVDILFIRAIKNPDNTYTETNGTTDIFGGILPQSFEMRFSGINNKINFVGSPIKDNGMYRTFNANYNPDPATAVTIGNSDKTIVGTPEFKEYDNILPDHINAGSAHIRGAFVFPFSENSTKAGLTVVVTKAPSTVRTIYIADGIPVERNKVTLVKVYVLSGTIFDTTLNFDISIETAWDGCNIVEEEV